MFNARGRAEGEEMRAARLQELQEMAAKLLATAGEFSPRQDHYNALGEIGRFRAQIVALEGVDLPPARRGLKAKGKWCLTTMDGGRRLETAGVSFVR